MRSGTRRSAGRSGRAAGKRSSRTAMLWRCGPRPRGCTDSPAWPRAGPVRALPRGSTCHTPRCPRRRVARRHARRVEGRRLEEWRFKVAKLHGMTGGADLLGVDFARRDVGILRLRRAGQAERHRGGEYQSFHAQSPFWSSVGRGRPAGPDQDQAFDLPCLSQRSGRRALVRLSACSRRHLAIFSWSPESRISGMARPSQSRGRV